MFENRTILISSFNLETILSEKIETILKRGTFNSRMKDFYDVYYLLTTLRNEIDIKTIKKAINNTFIKRKSINYLKDYKGIINAIRNTDKIKSLWQSYIKKYPYAKNINILEILELLEEFIDKLNLEEVYI